LLREKRSRLGLPDLRIVARRVRDRNPFYLAFITNLNWHRIGWPLAAGRWPLAAGCWPLAAGCWPLAAGCWLLAAASRLHHFC